VRAGRLVVDALGRELRLAGSPGRIVSLVPSLTELLADLGLDDEVVGLTTFCVRPPGWRRRKTRVGGTKQVRVERVRDLRPDLVLANKEENVREQVEAIAAEAPVYVTDVADLPGAVAMIRAVGALVGRGEAAGALADEVAAGFDGLAAGPPIRTAYLIWRDPWITVGGDTFIHDVMGRAGLVNAFGDRRRYPAVDDDELRRAAPELVLLSSEPFPFDERHRAEVAAVGPDARVELVDGEPFSWYGSRLRAAADYLRALRQRLAG